MSETFKQRNVFIKRGFGQSALFLGFAFQFVHLRDRGWMRRLVERAVLYWFQFLRRRPRHHRDLADNQRHCSIVEATLSHDQFYYIYIFTKWKTAF